MLLASSFLASCFWLTISCLILFALTQVSSSIAVIFNFLICCMLLISDHMVRLNNQCVLSSDGSAHLCCAPGYPITLTSPLKFCPYQGSSCCNSTQDVQLQKQFQAMKVSDPACASIVKSMLCAVRLHSPIENREKK